MFNIDKKGYTILVSTPPLKIQLSKVIHSKLYRMELTPKITTIVELDEYLNDTLLNDDNFKLFATILRD